jgi:FtsP/CotA-like multicopper oxidase with cupredoxin domain
LQIVAIDGVAVNSQDGTLPGKLITESDFRLPPASRVEFIVNAPPASVKLAQLVTTNILTGQNGDDDPNRPFFTVQLVPSPDSDEPAGDDRVGTFTALNSSQQRFAGLASAPIAAKRLVYFDEIQPTQFFMVVDGQPEKVFDPNAAPAITAVQGTVEEWTIENHALENHEFHFHQLHFLVESQNNFKINGDTPAPGILGQYLDMVEVPNWDGNTAHPFPNVKVRIDFRGHDVGTFVFHCHILNHEDLGMMNIIQVVAPSASNPSSPKKAVASAKAPNAAKPAGPPAVPAGMDKMKMQ